MSLGIYGSVISGQGPPPLVGQVKCRIQYCTHSQRLITICHQLQNSLKRAPKNGTFLSLLLMAGTMTNPENSSREYIPDPGCGSLQNHGDSRHGGRAPPTPKPSKFQSCIQKKWPLWRGPGIGVSVTAHSLGALDLI